MTEIKADIEVLREMVRIAENRRNEEFENVEKVNRYNLALIAFSGSFLSLLLTAEIDVSIQQLAGACSILSILCSLLTVRPRTLKSGAISIEGDVATLRNNLPIQFKEFLLETADVTEKAGYAAGVLAKKKKNMTIIAATFLAASIIITYSMNAYA